MAWTPPTLGADFAVAEIVTASKLNSHVTDNLLYLKGSPIFDGTPVVGATGSPQSLTVFGNANGSTNGPIFAKNTSAGTIGTGLALDASGATSGRSFSLLSIASAVAPVGGFGIYDNTAGAMRLVVDSTGKVGIGTSAPAGPLEVKGAAGSRIMMLFADNVDSTLQTIAPAGTCVAGATFFIMDRNNTGGTCFQGASGAACQLGGSSSYNNTDTITYAVTAGGAITVQRTTGSNGTHDMAILAFVF